MHATPPPPPQRPGTMRADGTMKTADEYRNEMSAWLDATRQPA
jgi:hypothetical protein